MKIEKKGVMESSKKVLLMLFVLTLMSGINVVYAITSEGAAREASGIMDDAADDLKDKADEAAAEERAHFNKIIIISVGILIVISVVLLGFLMLNTKIEKIEKNK